MKSVNSDSNDYLFATWNLVKIRDGLLKPITYKIYIIRPSIVLIPIWLQYIYTQQKIDLELSNYIYIYMGGWATIRSFHCKSKN